MKILVIDLDNIGDVVMASFIPRALRNLFPDSYISFLVKEYSKGVLVNNPFINELIIFNPPWLGDILNKKFSWRETWKLIKKLRVSNFDLAIIVNADWRKTLIARLANIPKRIGQDRKNAKYLLTKIVPYRDDPRKHTVEYNLDLVRALGVNQEKTKLEIFLDEVASGWADDCLNNVNLRAENIIIGIHPGAGDPNKMWPQEKFIDLIKKLIKKPQIVVLVFGSKADPQAREIVTKINNQRVIFANDNSILQMGALFKKCNYVITHDTGPMHVACAVGTKVVAIFGPSNPRRFGPYGKGHIIVRKEMDCSPCGSDPDCNKLDCIKNIEVNDVEQALVKLGVLK